MKAYHEKYFMGEDIHRKNVLYSFCRFSGCDIHLEVPGVTYLMCEFDDSCVWYYHGQQVDPMFEREE